jgi:hypothetical protein
MTAVSLARKIQKRGMTISFWFYDHKPKIIEVNVHTLPGSKGGGIVNKIVKTEKELVAFLLTFLVKE